MAAHTGELAIVTGASTGIGYELAKIAASEGYDLVLCADEAEIEEAGKKLRLLGTKVETVQADLATEHGVAALWDRVSDRKVDVLMANAGRTLGDSFLDEEFEAARKVVELNIVGTISLVHKVGRQMRARDAGRILITGSIVGVIPGPFQAVYNGTKAFLNSFSEAIANELKETAVTVTCLEPGLTETEVFDRAGMEDTPVAQAKIKDDPAFVARTGYDAMHRGTRQVAPGFMNKVQTTFAGIIPDALLAQMHRHVARPEGDKQG